MAKSFSTPLAPSLDDSSCSVVFAEARTETVRMADINEFLICKLCKGYLRDPYTVKECLHTFCYGCIRGYYLYDGESCSCPTCRVRLGAKPWTHIMPDPAMKELTEKLLPDYSVKEEEEERVFYSKLGIKRKRVDAPATPRRSRSKTSGPRGPSPGNMTPFEIYPQRGPGVPLFLQLDKLHAPCINTQALFKIIHLRKYLAKKLKGVNPEEIEILCKGVVVGPEYSLEFIRRTRWKEDSKMILEYRRQIVAS
ncbi:hypothetical protein PF005_g3230 [Phytophthora fragariae]|uniref:RING-type domain-containing protein n=1 Tax=Phytophthora fragariae TaxID=53985 RepID=A0A6A3ZAC5_9STRA|nr:hypothetical protein PF003_g8499 [Phytophthora fragariae]KAE8946928.1 hypothetical protein PF009_g3449 [Phytophthora fragariae]KAE9026363.1 hypothetical protein PF011_g2579 [Phytophthora fragariae]KAE9133507.1 hypothetical protein PF010_g2775 [Phytophthora fragariae]KAE9133741.1 hypothetical protein PF007_g3202 [Phytophthora fragariae]